MKNTDEAHLHPYFFVSLECFCFFDTTDTISAFLLTFCSAVFEPTESNFRRDLIET